MDYSCNHFSDSYMNFTFQLTKTVKDFAISVQYVFCICFHLANFSGDQSCFNAWFFTKDYHWQFCFNDLVVKFVCVLSIVQSSVSAPPGYTVSCEWCQGTLAVVQLLSLLYFLVHWQWHGVALSTTVGFHLNHLIIYWHFLEPFWIIAVSCYCSCVETPRASWACS